MKLRSSASSFWLACFMLSCSSSEPSNNDQQTTVPLGSGSAPPAVTGSATGSTAAPLPSTMTSTPVASSGGLPSAMPQPSASTAVTTMTSGSGGGPPLPTATASGSGGGGDPPMPSASTSDTAPAMSTAEPPPPPPPEPSLIVSSENNFWQVGEVTPVDAGTANFTVTSATEHQDWHGWGGTFNEAGWDALMELSEADRTRAISLLFDDVDGLDLDWGRIPIGPSDYALDRYTLLSAAGEFSIARDEQALIPYIHAAQTVKDNVKYWGSPWTPPPHMKNEAGEGGYDMGYFNTEYNDEYADFFVDWIQAYETAGIPIDFVMPQNEPGWAQSYPTCAWGPATDSTNNSANVYSDQPLTLATFVDQYLFPRLDDAGLSTKVWFGTLSNSGKDVAHWNDMVSKPSFSRIVGAGLQWECIAQVETVLQTGKLVMQSEHRCGNYPWANPDAPPHVKHQVDQLPTQLAPNDFNYGIESWELFSDWIKRGVNIYSAWNMVLDTHGTNLDSIRVWNQNALLVVDRDTKELKITPYYYVFRHLAQYVDEGAKRVEISGDALAFKNADGSIVAVMRTAAAGDQIVSIDGTLLQFAASGNGWVTVNWKPE